MEIIFIDKSFTMTAEEVYENLKGKVRWRIEETRYFVKFAAEKKRDFFGDWGKAKHEIMRI